jgi:hypothetical protein
MRALAGTKALGALPKAAMPAGKPNTPAPTMALTKLKISLGMVAVPPAALVVVVACFFLLAVDGGGGERFLEVAVITVREDAPPRSVWRRA